MGKSREAVPPLGQLKRAFGDVRLPYSSLFWATMPPDAESPFDSFASYRKGSFLKPPKSALNIRRSCMSLKYCNTFADKLNPRSLSIDPIMYLPFLAQRFQTAGGRFLRASLSSLSSVKQLDDLSTSSILAIVNCSGLGSSSLCDVHDDTLVPSRKQSCLVRAPWHTEGDYHSEDKDGWFWIMSRPGGLVNIGGLIQVGQTCVLYLFVQT